jgi:hypothetical protein
MIKGLMIAIFSVSLTVSMASSEALGEGSEDNDIADLYRQEMFIWSGFH